MLTQAKQEKLLASLKSYVKRYFSNNLTDLDESGTRILINSFLTDVLGFLPIEEIKTEYMIRGTYADYMIQIGGTRHFLVEVKALSLNLSEKHLRQTINYGANEGLEWALLTNGKSFELYKIIFNKPIEAIKVFSIDLSDGQLKTHAENLQYLHKDSVKNKGLESLWNKTVALDPKNVAGMLYSPQVIGYIKKSLKDKYGAKFEEENLDLEERYFKKKRELDNATARVRQEIEDVDGQLSGDTSQAGGIESSIRRRSDEVRRAQEQFSDLIAEERRKIAEIERAETELTEEFRRQDTIEVGAIEALTGEEKKEIERIDQAIKTATETPRSRIDALPEIFRGKEESLTREFESEEERIRSEFEELRKRTMETLLPGASAGGSDLAFRVRKLREARRLLDDYEAVQWNYKRNRKAWDCFREGTYESWTK